MTRMPVLFMSSTLIAVTAALASPGRAAARLPLPLLIQEALADDPAQEGFQLLPGVDRVQEPVTLGIPLPTDSGVSSIDELGLAGVTAAQFRVLSRWPDGGLQWVLLDTQVDCPAGAQARSVSLTVGAGNFGGPDLATDLPATIAIDTGAALFSVRKQGFNLIDAVTVGGTALVLPGSSAGVVLTDPDGVTYSAANDGSVQVSLEENGPVRAVVVAKGTHRSDQGGRYLDFTVRMHFFKGKSRVRIFYTLRNASKEQFTNAPLATLELVLKTTLAPSEVAFGRELGEYRDALAPADSMRLFQGVNDFPIEASGWASEIVEPTSLEGYRLTKNGLEVASGTRGHIINLFYARAQDAAASAVTFGRRFAAGGYPQGLGIDGDGTVRVGLLPPGNDKTFYVRFNSWSTHEVLLDFSGPGSDSGSATAREALFRFQYPLAGRAANRGYYHDTGAIWEDLVSFSDEYGFNVAQGWADPDTPTTYCNPGDTNACASVPRDLRPSFRIFRAWGWPSGGGENQYDLSRRGLLNFLREDASYGAGYLLDAEQRVSFTSDRGVLHADDYPIGAGDAEHGIPAYGGNNSAWVQAPNFEFVDIYGDNFDYEHPHASGIGMAYFLTGDERLREAYLQWGEVMLTPNDFEQGDRSLAWLLFNLTDLYRFTARREFRDQAWAMLRDEVLDRTAVYQQAYGTDWDRGFYVALRDQWDWSGNLYAERSMAPFIKAAMYPRSYAYFHDYGAETELERDRTRDVLEGAVRYAAGELWYEYSQEPGNFGFPYRVSPDEPVRDVRQDEDWYGGVRECFATFLHGYLLTGEQEFLRQGTLLQKGLALGENRWNYNFPEKEALDGLLMHPERFATWLPLAVDAVENPPGGGAFDLSWEAPEGARQYWIKYADRPIVAWLGFARDTGQFAFDPAQYEPFFAAQNVAGEPTPAPAGTVQTMTVSGLEPGKVYHFAARYLGSAADVPAAGGPATAAAAVVLLGLALRCRRGAKCGYWSS
ncbi:MAG: hypothetical protein HYV63_04030 [Candidatus Schekmanbacteria bacterium]|nr:hypothetical protein [Candidatus Schekmanbacteria bacterium]